MLTKRILSFYILVSSLNAQAKVLLISMDGFRWDYLENANTPNFNKLISEGSHVKQVTNVFSTVSFPNHWSIITGLYEEDHGIISNKFLDEVLNETYDFSADTKWYNSSEPLWITAEKEGKKSGAYMWNGNQAIYAEARLTKVQKFISDADHRKSFDTAVDWLSKDDLEFVCLYLNEPDLTGHWYGPKSQEVKKKVEELDGLIGHMMDRFKDHNLNQKVNIIIASDHGMTEVSNDRSIILEPYVDFKKDIDWADMEAIGLIHPKKDKIESVYTALKRAERDLGHFKVYKKDEIPDNLYYKNHRRVPPIVLIAEQGWMLKQTNDTSNMTATHGYNNAESDMKSLLIARGPNIKCGYKQNELRSVDIYPLICDLLGLKKCHKSRGLHSNIKNIITTDFNHCLSEYSMALKHAGHFHVLIFFSLIALYVGLH